MLGRQAPATMASFLKLASLKEGVSGISQDKMVNDLVESHQSMIKQCNLLIHFTEEAEADDPGTADLIIKQIRYHEKQAWLLKSHLT